MENEIVEDPEMISFLKPFQDLGTEKLGDILGMATHKLEGDRRVTRYQQTALGKLIGHSYMEVTKADLAVVNSGGIRTSLEQGKISYRDIRTVVPFANSVCSVEMKGSEIKNYIDGALKKEKGTGAYPQIAGALVVVKNGKIKSLKVGGKEISPNKMYRMAINQYMASGGDGYPLLENHPRYIDTGYPDYKVVGEYIKKHGPINPWNLKTEKSVINL